MSRTLTFIFVFGMLLIGLASCNTTKKSTDNKSEDPRIKSFNFNYYFLEANKQKILGNYEEALRHYFLAFQVDETQAAVCYEIAGILNLAQDFGGAMEYAEKAVDLDKTGNEYYQLMLAFIYQNNNLNSKSAEVYKKLIKQFPNQINYYFELANAYVLDENYKDAIAILDNAEKQFGILDIISLEKERCYHKLDMHDKASQEIENLVAANPENAKYKTLLAEAYVNSNRISDARILYQEIEKMEIQDGIVYFSMADFYRSQREFDKSFKFLADGFQRDDVNIDIKVRMMISMLDIMGNDNFMIGNVKYLMEVLSEKYPEELKVRALNADFLMFTGENKLAQKEFDYLLSKDKSRYEIWEQALYLDYLLDDMDAMFLRSKEAVELFPNVVELYRYYIISSYYTENHQDVIDAVSYASLISTSNQPLLLEFLSLQGDSYHKLNQHHESDSVYEIVLDKDEQYISVLNNYSYYLAIRGDKLERALELSSKLVELEPKNSAYLDTHAWVLFKNGKYEEALSNMNKALTIHPDNPVYYDHKGDILFMKGEKDQALEMWKKSAELGEPSEELLLKIQTENLQN